MFYAWKSVKWTLLWLVKDKTGQHHNVCKVQCPTALEAEDRKLHKQVQPTQEVTGRSLSASCHGPATLESLCSTRFSYVVGVTNPKTLAISKKEGSCLCNWPVLGPPSMYQINMFAKSKGE